MKKVFIPFLILNSLLLTQLSGVDWYNPEEVKKYYEKYNETFGEGLSANEWYTPEQIKEYYEKYNKTFPKEPCESTL